MHFINSDMNKLYDGLGKNWKNRFPNISFCFHFVGKLYDNRAHFNTINSATYQIQLETNQRKEMGMELAYIETAAR